MKKMREYSTHLPTYIFCLIHFTTFIKKVYKTALIFACNTFFILIQLTDSSNPEQLGQMRLLAQRKT